MTDTQEKIKRGFYSLLSEMPYSKVTVKAVTNHLGMSRQNFYRYYLSKEEILLDIVDETFDGVYMVTEQHLLKDSFDTDKVTAQALEIIEGNKQVISSVLSSGTESIVFAHSIKFIRRLLGRIIRTHNMVIVDHDYLDILVEAFAAHAFHVVKSWSEHDFEVERAKVFLLLQPQFKNLINSLEVACRESVEDLSQRQ